MLKNMNYDLTEELAERSKSIWRYDQYLKDVQQESTNCNCQHLWQQLKQQDEQSLEMLKNEIKNHVETNMFE